MKTKILAIASLFIFAATICMAQNNGKVPIAVKEKLISMYPAATGADWEATGDLYEAEFKDGDKEVSVLFDATGKHIQTETQVSIESLPAGVKDYASNRQQKPIDEASQITDAAGTITYEAEIGGDDYLFDSNGKLMGMEEDGDDDEDDNEDDD